MLSRARGFTIIELLVGLTLLAILAGLAAPAMGTYLQNSKLASVTASYFTGLQTARTEAIRRNVRTEFVLTDTPVSTGNLSNALTTAVGGRNWVVRAASGPASFLPAIEARSGAEGEGSAAGSAVLVAGSASAPAVFDGRIPFNGFGGTADGASYSIAISNPVAGLCVADGGTIRCRRINISPGGQIRSCDPSVVAAGDNRAC